MAEMIKTDSALGPTERWDHFKARWGIKRMEHRVSPGLYSLGEPTVDSKVFVTSNYTLSFDALRSSLEGQNAYILVLDTKGINVWCAAGKGTFGTEELLSKIESTGLKDVVSHRKLILPQLGAPGVNANEVRRKSGFKVEYGPVRANDLPEYIRLGRATEEMRRVRFPLRDRVVLIPVEIRNYLLYLLLFFVVSFLVLGLFHGLMVLTLTLTGLALFPALFPFLPTKDFSSKGLILGATMVAPFAIYQLLAPNVDIRLGLTVMAEFLLYSAWVSYLALNFTGSTTVTSRTGVRKEIFRYIPIMAGSAVTGGALVAIVAVGAQLGWL